MLWAGRRGAFGAIARLAPTYLVQDGTVPRTKLAETLRTVLEIGRKHRVRIANVAHAGDGNLHPLMLLDPKDEDEAHRVHEAGKEILQLCIDMGGTLTGEHGIGIEKQAAMPLLFSNEELESMRRIKRAIDPGNESIPTRYCPGAGGRSYGGVVVALASRNAEEILTRLASALGPRQGRLRGRDRPVCHERIEPSRGGLSL